MRRAEETSIGGIRKTGPRIGKTYIRRIRAAYKKGIRVARIRKAGETCSRGAGAACQGIGKTG
jgi:hypothetical protein